MCGNVQVIFYKRKNDSDIIVKVLLNEREASLPVASDILPYYHWADVRRLWMHTAEAISLPATDGDE